MNSDVSSPKNSLDEITLVMEYLSLRDDISAPKENYSLDAIKVAYYSLQKLRQPSTPEDLKACIDMSKSLDAKFLEICITSLVLDSRNSVILDKILDDIPCVLQLLLKRMYRLPWEEANDFWRLLEALCTSSERIGTIASCFAHYLIAEYLKPEYRGCVDQMSLAAFTARIISGSKDFVDASNILNDISSSFFEVGKLYAPGIRYTLRSSSVRQRLKLSKKIEFTPDSNLIDCAHAIIAMLTSIESNTAFRDYVPEFASLLKHSTFINDLGPKFSCLGLSSRKGREIDCKDVLVDVFIKIRKHELISDYSLFLPLLITWIQEDDFKSETQRLNRAVLLLLRILEEYTTSITPSQYELVVMELLSLMERYPPGSAAQESWMDLDIYSGENLRKKILEVLDSVAGDKVLSLSQKERLREIYKGIKYRIELPNRISKQIFGRSYQTIRRW